MATFTCFDCGKEKEESTKGGTGYASLPGGNKVCYECCAERDRIYMRDNGQTALYLVKNDKGQYEVTNWPGSLRIPINSIRKGRHNIARVQYHVRFTFEGAAWYGVQTGDNTQIIRCRQYK